MLPIFVHIPRTAGTSLQHAAEKLWGKQHIVAIYGSDIENPGPVCRKMINRRTKLVRGHFSYGIHDYIKQDVGYFTIVRHPVDRVRSLYNYIQNSKPHPFHEAVKPMTLTQFVTSGVSLEVDNGQVRQLCGLAGELPQTPYAHGSFPFGQIKSTELHMACVTLAEQFEFVITLPQIQELPRLLREHFGWHWMALGHRNKAKGRHQSELTDQEYALIEERNHHDMLLYAYVQNVLGGIYG